MIDITQLRVGDEVHYQPTHYGNERWENGLVKEIREDVVDGVWVVYNCAGIGIDTRIIQVPKQIYRI